MDRISHIPFDAVALAVTVVTAVVVAMMASRFDKKLKRVEHQYWTHQKTMELRVETFNQMAPLANTIYCYASWRGDWRDYSPKAIIEKKRILDRIYYTNIYLLPPNVQHAFTQFMNTFFKSYQGAGLDAGIRAYLHQGTLSRRDTYSGHWQDEWNDSLVSTTSTNAGRSDFTVPSSQEQKSAYFDLMESFRAALEPQSARL